MNTLRKRELFLSLKYCTIEACFSVPMLALTLGNAPFLGAYASKVLGWSDQAVGLLSALHYATLFAQPPLTYWLQRRFSLFHVTVLGFLFNILPWPLTALFPVLPATTANVIFTCVVATASFANAFCGVAWTAAVSEVVPLHIRGRFFGKRWVVFTFWSLVTTLVVQQVVKFFETPERAVMLPTVFGWIFTALALLRLCGLCFFYRMKFPSVVMEPRPPAPPVRAFAEVFRDGNFMRFVAVIGLFNFCFYLGQPFYGVFLLKDCGFQIGDVTVLFVVQSLGNMASFAAWGRLTDRFGNKPIMMASGALWFATAAVAWQFTRPGRHAHVYANYFVTGFMMAGCQQVGLFTLMMKLTPAHSRANHLSVYYALANLFGALGAALGGQLLRWLPRDAGSWFGQPLTNYHVFIVGSLLLCLLVLHLLQFVHEPAERPMRELVQEMGRMREFNPVLGLGELARVFTPGGLGRLAGASWRTLRRQTSAVSAVGEHLAEDGWRALKQPLKAFSKDEDLAQDAGPDGLRRKNGPGKPGE